MPLMRTYGLGSMLAQMFGGEEVPDDPPETTNSLTAAADFWKRRYESMCQAAETFQAQFHGEQKTTTMLREQVRNCQQALDIQKQIVRDQLTQDNAATQAAAAEIQRLRGKLTAAGIDPD